MQGFCWAAVAALALVGTPDARAGWLGGGDSLTEPFLARPHYFDAALSPDGKHLAAVVIGKEGGSQVEITDLDNNTAWMLPRINEWMAVPGQRRLGTFSSYPMRAMWATNDLIAVDFTGNLGVLFKATGGTVGPAYEQYLGSIRVDGDTGRSIVVWSGEDHRPRRLTEDASKLVPFSIGLEGAELYDLRADATGVVRIARTIEHPAGAAPRVVVWYRKAMEQPWKRLDERAVTDEPFDPVTVTDATERIVVLAHNGSDRLAVWNYDVDRHAFLDAVASATDADVVVRAEGLTREGVAAVVTDGLLPKTTWFDARMSRLQAAVDTALPDHVNVLHAGTARRILVRSYSDIDPGYLYVLDSETLKMERIGAYNADIDPARMQPKKALHYASFDGLSIPAYLTLPGKPSRPSPTIVLIHGGPWERDRWEWNAEVQAFAAHGYAVFQPQFRGSSGFGKQLEEAGYGQWGLAMQDDITAGVHFLIDQHIADPARICIIGASYGGYAALWGLVKTPALYRCGVSISGVSDIQRRLTDDSDSSKSEWARAFMKSRIGDPSLMRSTWDSVSPLKHADQIQAPLLLVHGRLDVRVPISHSALMLEAMQAANKDVEWLDFPGEGHNVFHPDNQRLYYKAVFKLLERTIGKGDPPASK